MELVQSLQLKDWVQPENCFYLIVSMSYYISGIYTKITVFRIKKNQFCINVQNIAHAD